MRRGGLPFACRCGPYIRHMMSLHRLGAALILAILIASGPATATEAGWALLREGGHVVLLRHAMTAGAADPANVDPEDCSTQRNLSDRGQQQARKIGALFAARAERTEAVLSSRYCRAMDTARLAFREAEPFAALDPPPADPALAADLAKQLLGRIRAFSGSGNLVMVTHLETIAAVAGASPREGEAVVVRAEGEQVQVLGRIVFN